MVTISKPHYSKVAKWFKLVGQLFSNTCASFGKFLWIENIISNYWKISCSLGVGFIIMHSIERNLEKISNYITCISCST